MSTYLEAVRWEQTVKPGDICLARWTNCYTSYEGKVEVLRVNRKSFGVKLLVGITQYRAGQTLSIPNTLDLTRWSVNNRLAPLAI